MSRSLRQSYPEKVRYMTRFDAGSIQRVTGLPASLIYRLREGEVKSLSPSTEAKLSDLYDIYWTSRLEKRGVNTEERESLVRTAPVEKLREVANQNYDVARLIVEQRRERDKDLPNYKPSWHTIKDVMKQMAKDLERTSEDWLFYSGSPKGEKR